MPSDVNNHNNQNTSHQSGSKEQPLPLVILFDSDVFARNVSMQQLTKAGWVVLAIDTSKAEEIRYVADLLIDSLPDPVSPNHQQQQSQPPSLFIMPTGHDQISYVKLMAVVLEATHPVLPSATAPFPPLPSAPWQEAIRAKYPVPPPPPGYKPPAAAQLNPAHSLSASEIIRSFVERGVSFKDIPTILYTDDGPGLAIARHLLAFFAAGKHSTAPLISTALERYAILNLDGVVFTTPISALVPVPGSTTNPRAFQVLPVYLSLQPNSDDRLIAVLAHLTGCFMCRGCHRPLAPDEPAALLAYYQLWCQECIAARLGQPMPPASDPGGKLLAFPSPLAINTQPKVNSGSNNSLNSKAEQGSHMPPKIRPIRLAQRREQYQTTATGYEGRPGKLPPFFPARLLVKAAYSRAMGLSTMGDEPAKSKRRRARPSTTAAKSSTASSPTFPDPWNSA